MTVNYKFQMEKQEKTGRYNRSHPSGMSVFILHLGFDDLEKFLLSISEK